MKVAKRPLKLFEDYIVIRRKKKRDEKLVTMSPAEGLLFPLQFSVQKSNQAIK